MAKKKYQHRKEMKLKNVFSTVEDFSQDKTSPCVFYGSLMDFNKKLDSFQKVNSNG